MTAYSKCSINGALALIVAACIFWGCKEREKTVRSTIEDKIGQQINFVDTLKAYSLSGGWKTPVITQRYKIVTFIDGTCSSCVEDLKEWKNLIAELKSQKVDVLIYIHVFTPDLIISVLKDIDFRSDVIVGYRNTFFYENELDDDKAFQTFLVDDDEILYVGNPIKKLAIKKLFLKTINGD
ncbi:MAG TPA: hypothetical protein PKX08_04255 [Cyclobacteriaceae bacterium]|nr:hypothetical protein [Cyclobacteriaceae bacterium]